MGNTFQLCAVLLSLCRCAGSKASAKGWHAQERRYSAAGYTPEGSPSDLRPGTYYLTHVDELYRRFYARREDHDA